MILHVPCYNLRVHHDVACPMLQLAYNTPPGVGEPLVEGVGVPGELLAQLVVLLLPQRLLAQLLVAVLQHKSP